MNWLCDIRTWARDNLHADAPRWRLDSQVPRHWNQGYLGLGAMLLQHISSYRIRWTELHIVGLLLVWVSQIIVKLLFLDITRSEVRTLVKIGKCRDTGLAPARWVGTPRANASAVWETQGCCCSRLLSCFKGNPPESLESVFANFCRGFKSDTAVSWCEEEAVLIWEQSSSSYWYFQTVPRIFLSFFCKRNASKCFISRLPSDPTPCSCRLLLQ